jgi:hypothetical protein
MSVSGSLKLLGAPLAIAFVAPPAARGSSLGKQIKRPWGEGSKTRILAASFGDVAVTRLDPVTLRLRPIDGFFPSDSSKVFRSSARPYHAGEVVNLSNMTATITEITDDRRPQIVEFRFATPLESPEWLWMRGVPGGLAEWTPPKVGESVVVAAAR